MNMYYYMYVCTYVCTYCMYVCVCARKSQLKTLKINTQLYYSIYGFHLTHPHMYVCICTYV